MPTETDLRDEVTTINFPPGVGVPENTLVLPKSAELAALQMTTSERSKRHRKHKFAQTKKNMVKDLSMTPSAIRKRKWRSTASNREQDNSRRNKRLKESRQNESMAERTARRETRRARDASLQAQRAEKRREELCWKHALKNGDKMARLRTHAFKYSLHSHVQQTIVTTHTHFVEANDKELPLQGHIFSVNHETGEAREVSRKELDIAISRSEN